jgi:hypothetical protein
MDIPADADGGGCRDKHGLVHEDVLDFTDDPRDLELLELDDLARFLVLDLEQSVYYGVDVDLDALAHFDWLFIINFLKGLVDIIDILYSWKLGLLLLFIDKVIDIFKYN